MAPGSPNPKASHQVKGLTPPVRNAHVYIDNSNLWIQGQRTWAERHGLRSDPLWRFDAGKVIDLVKSHLSPVEDGEEVLTNVSLYGSSPPPVDTVWRAFAARNVSISTFARSSLTGKEKQVDTELAVQSSMRAMADMKDGESSEFVIISGDADLYSAAAAIAKMCGFVVHVWSWNNALASVYRRLLAEEPNGLIRVHLLDPFLDQIGFRETRFDTSRASISPHSIVVLDPLSRADAIDAFLSGLDEPVYRYQFEPRRDDASSCDLVIIPAGARNMSHEELVNLFQSAVNALGKLGITVLTYLEYQQGFTHPGQASHLTLSERFSELPLNVAGPPPVSPVLSNASVNLERVRDDDVTNAFTEVNQRSEKHRLRLRANEAKMASRCDWRLYCEKGLACHRGHTEEEKAYFKTYSHKKATKYVMCWDGNQCTKGPRCTFAHSDAELLCPTCDKRGAGHSMWECPESMRNKKRAGSF